MSEIGTLQCFKHFSLYLRSEEELFVTINNHNRDTTNVANEKLDLVNFDPGL